MPPDGDAVTVGALLSIVYTCVPTAPLFPAVSLAKNFKVVVVEIVIDEE